MTKLTKDYVDQDIITIFIKSAFPNADIKIHHEGSFLVVIPPQDIEVMRQEFESTMKKQYNAMRIKKTKEKKKC